MGGLVALALYRKYRPRTFAEVIGQEHVTEPLSQALRSGRLHHAYLFSGPRGCGKTSSARILARSLNCERGPTPEPCGVCESCRALAPDGSGSIDVIEIDAASHGGVDDARELRERAFFAPASSRFKIYVIDEAHMVSTQGFNALLKLVEEPPDYVKFIFATTEPDKVLATIKSRTHHYPFRLIPPGVLRPYLEQLAEAEIVKVEPAVFPLVVRGGGGSARDSLSLLDQLIAGAGPEGVSYHRAVALLGVTDAALIDEMCDALAAGDGAVAYATIDRVAEAGHDPRRFASDLLERLRDLIVLQQVPDAATKGLIDGPSDQLERMQAQAQRLGPATLSRAADIVHNGLVEMRGTTAPRLLLELVTARMLLPGADDATNALLQRVERMERRLTLSGEDQDQDSGVRRPSATAATTGRTGPASSGSALSAGGEAATPVRPPAAVAPPAPPARDDNDMGAGRPGEKAPASAGGDSGPGDTRPTARPTPPPSAVMADPATPDPVIPHAAPAGELDAAAVRRVWDELLTMVGNKSKRAAAVAREATVRDIDGDTLVLTFRHSFHADALAKQPELVAEAAYELLGVRWQIRCELAGSQRAAGGADGGSGTGVASGSRGGPAGADEAAGGDEGAGPSPRSAPRQEQSHRGQPAPDAGARSQQDRAVSASGDHSRGPGRSHADQGPGAGAEHPASDDDDWPETAQPGGQAPAATEAGAPDDHDGDDASGPAARPAASGGSSPISGQHDGESGAPRGWSDGSYSGGRPGADRAGRSSPGGATAATAGAGDVGSAGASAAARAAARAAAGRNRSTTATAPGAAPRPRQARPAAQRSAPTQADADWAGEPPYDPDYDGPVGGGRAAAGSSPAHALAAQAPQAQAPQAQGPQAQGPQAHAPQAQAGQAQAPARPGPAPVQYEGFDPGDEPTDEVIDEKTARQTSEQQALQLLQEALGAERIGEVELK